MWSDFRRNSFYLTRTIGGLTQILIHLLFGCINLECERTGLGRIVGRFDHPWTLRKNDSAFCNKANWLMRISPRRGTKERMVEYSRKRCWKRPRRGKVKTGEITFQDENGRFSFVCVLRHQTRWDFHVLEWSDSLFVFYVIKRGGISMCWNGAIPFLCSTAT
jgi:hypothetical protein